jgi:hypothetical protein
MLFVALPCVSVVILSSPFALILDNSLSAQSWSSRVSSGELASQKMDNLPKFQNRKMEIVFCFRRVLVVRGVVVSL